MKKKKEKPKLSNLQLKAIDSWTSRWLGVSLGLAFFIHNLFFLGFMFASLFVFVGNYILSKVYHKYTSVYFDILLKMWAVILFSSVPIQFILHNAFSFGYQINAIATLVGCWICIKVYGKKRSKKR